jgi:5-methylcytosine-specific restriction endonuclease McrA
MTCTEKKRLNSPSQPVGRWIRVEKRLAVNLRDRFTCLICLKDLSGAEPMDVTLDHIVPKADGGGNKETNIYTCCRKCNCARQDKPLSRFVSAETLKHVRRNAKRSLKPYLKLSKAFFADEVGREDLIEKCTEGK